MSVSGLRAHIARLRHQFGRPIRLGAESYRVRGYWANRLACDFKHEPHLLPLLRKLLQARAGAFIDIGANVGQTLIKILAIDPARAYVGFEPQIACCFAIDQFIKDNSLHRAKVLPLALSNENRIIPLFWDAAYDEMASIAEDLDASGQKRRFSTPVSARIGDEVLHEMGLNVIAAIKIDVEGAELDVLSGLAVTLSEVRPPVLFEVLPNFYGTERAFLGEQTRARNTARAEEIYEFFARAGYSIFQIDQRGDAEAIARFDLDDRQNYLGSDYLATAGEL